MQAEWGHTSIRHGLITMLPRLKRFADVLAGDRSEGRTLLARSLRRVLAEPHRYQRGTPLDRFAFAEIYRLWLLELRDHADPMRGTKSTDESFERLFLECEGDEVDPLTASFLANLPPQQRCTLLLVYGEGFDLEDAGRVLELLPGYGRGARDACQRESCRSARLRRASAAKCHGRVPLSSGTTTPS